MHPCLALARHSAPPPAGGPLRRGEAEEGSNVMVEAVTGGCKGVCVGGWGWRRSDGYKTGGVPISGGGGGCQPPMAPLPPPPPQPQGYGVLLGVRGHAVCRCPRTRGPTLRCAPSSAGWGHSHAPKPPHPCPCPTSAPCHGGQKDRWCLWPFVSRPIGRPCQSPRWGWGGGGGAVGMHWKGVAPLQGAQPMPSHRLPDGKRRLQWHL